MVLMKHLLIIVAFLLISCDEESGNENVPPLEIVKSLSEKQIKDCKEKRTAADETYIFKNNSSQYGVINSCGIVRVPPMYEKMKHAGNGVYLFRNENKYGFISNDGDVIIPAVFDAARHFSDSMAAVLVKDINKWGYIDRAGTFVIPPQFDEAYSFTKNIALTKIDGVFYLQKKNAKKKQLIEADKTGFINTKHFRNLLYGSTIPAADRVHRTSFPSVLDITAQCGGKYIFFKDETIFLIDDKGSMNFKKKIPGITGYRAFCSEKENRNHAGRIGQFLLVKNKHGEWGALNKDGVLVIPIAYTDIYVLSSNVAAISNDGGNNFLLFSEEKAVSGKNKKFKSLKHLNKGAFAAQNDKGRWVVFSAEGTRLNNRVYSTLTDCTGCVAVAQKEKNEMVYSIDTSGKEIPVNISAEKILHAFDASVVLWRRHKKTDTIFTEIQNKKNRNTLFRKKGHSQIVKLYKNAVLIRFVFSGEVMLVRENGSVLWMEKTKKAEKNFHKSKKQLTFTAVSAGRYHTCGIDTKGRAWCWGGGNYGKLGTGDITDRTIPTPVDSSLMPKKPYLVSISAGETHTCALSKKGTAFCWGDGHSGRLGDGESTIFHKSTIPVAVDMSHITDKKTPVSIHTGTTHACLTYPSRKIYCWGAVKKAPGTSLPTNVPEQIFFPPITNRYKNKMISIGGYHSCIATQKKVLCLRYDLQDTHVLPPGSTENQIVTALSVGYSHACFTTENGRLYCFCGNMYGQTGTLDNMIVKEPVSVKRYDNPGKPFIQSVSAGGKRTCVLEKTGTVYCRGKIKKDKKHYLTSGTSSLNKITDRHGESLKNIVDITVGYDHACARNKKGAVFCWGNGKYGQLGNGVSGAEYYEKNAVRCGIITRQ